MKKRCFKCKKWIDLEKEHYTLIKTANRTKGKKALPDDEVYFHFQCWIDYFHECVIKKMQIDTKMALQKFLPVFQKVFLNLKEQ